MAESQPPPVKPPGGPPLRVPCPQCRALSPWEGNPYRPFCSERCQVIDRAAWAEEKYSLPSEDSAPRDEEERE